MSYILDALLKSERERQRKQAQIQDMVLTEPSASRAGRRPWVAWLVGAAVALNLASLGYFWAKNRGAEPPAVAADQREAAPKHSPPPRHTGESASQEARVPASPASPKTETAATPPVQIGSQAGSAAKASPAGGAAGQPKSPPAPVVGTRRDAAEPRGGAAMPAATAAKAVKPEAKAQPARAAVDIPPPNPPAAEPPKPTAADVAPAVPEIAEPAADAEPLPAEAETQAPLLRSMPADFQAKIPPLKISAHAYFRDPKKRFAVINMTRYEAGAEVTDGVKLEAIDAEGLILNYGGTRFRVNRP